MKNTFKLSALTLTFALAACGGSGGGGSAPAPVNTENTGKASTPQETKKPATTTNNSTPTTNNTNTEKPATDNSVCNKNAGYCLVDPTANDTATTKPNSQTTLDSGVLVELDTIPYGEVKNLDVGYGQITGYNRKYSFNGVWGDVKDASQLEVITKDGVVSRMLLGGISGALLNGQLSSAWNWASNQSKDYNREIFYFGDETPTANIPTSGVVTYKGNATRYDNLSSGAAALQNVGTSTLTADFNNKKISGELAMNGLRRNISLKETDIKGNSFTGKAVAGENSLFTTRQGEYEGKFFGPNADEVAGKATFAEEVKDLNTSFSAEKVATQK